MDYDMLENLQALHRIWRQYNGGPELSGTYVPGEGDNPVAMIIGEAPGAQEDIKRRPFVGKSGAILRELMAGAGLFTGETPHFGEPNCWLTNVVKFRPPGNKTPTPDQIMTARVLLREEWKYIGCPRIIIPVGNVSLHAVRGRRMSILNMAGKLYQYDSVTDGEPIYVWPMIHPSFGLRQKNMIPLIEKDWDEFAQWMAHMGETYG